MFDRQALLFCFLSGFNFGGIKSFGVFPASNDGHGLDQISFLDLVDRLHSPDHFSKYRMLPVQPWSCFVGDEELASIGVRTRVCHGEDSRSGMFEIRVNLILKTVPRTSASGSQRIAPLDHEICNHPVKAKTVIKACFLGFPGNRIFPGFGCFGQSHKIGHCLGDSLVIKLKQNFASGSFQFGIKSILQFFSTKDGMLKRKKDH